MEVLTVLIDLQYLAFTFGHIFYLTIVRLKILISICLFSSHNHTNSTLSKQHNNMQHVAGDIKHERDNLVDSFYPMI